MSKEATKFYEATRSVGFVDENHKPKFVVIKRNSHFLGKETIETEILHQSAYKKSDKTKDLMVFVVNSTDRLLLQKTINTTLKNNPFNAESPEEILPLLTGFDFKIVAELPHILNQGGYHLSELSGLKSGYEDHLLQSMEHAKTWLISYKKKFPDKFDTDNRLSNELDEIINKFKAVANDEGKISHKEKLRDDFYTVESQIVLENIRMKISYLKELQDKFKGINPEESNLQRLVKRFSSDLKELNKKHCRNKIKQLSESITEALDSYDEKFSEVSTQLKGQVDEVAKQLSELETLPLGEAKESLEKEFLDKLIKDFHTALKTESLAELKNNAELIKETFNAKFDLIKKDFVEVSKQKLETASKHVYSYYKAESATPILEEIASLQSMLADVSLNDVAQFGSAIESVNKCVESAEAFYNESSKDEQDLKIAFRKGSSNVTQFFAEKMNVLNDLKEHGKKIRNVSKLAHTKSDILGEIFAKAEEIKNQHQSLIETPVLDKSKAQKMNENISYIVKFIDDNKDTLSRYRGISALKPLAKLWGGGKVTSEKYINEIKDQLIKSENSVSAWSLAN